MKKFILSSALFFILLSSSIVISQPVWVNQPSGTSNDFNSVDFYDSQTGVAVGENGTIRRTQNGGTNWFAQSSGTSSHLRGVVLTSGDTGYIVGDAGVIRKTTNGGINWFSQISGLSNNLNAVHFVNSSTGFICGSNGIILKTIDGGINWVLQNSGSTNILTAIDFINNNTGFIIGHNKTVRKTTNGGINWFAQTLPSSIFGTLTSVSFANANTGTITKSNANGDRLIFHTTNGGVNWFSQDLGSVHSLRWVDYLDSDQGIIVGDEGDFFRSNNSGTNWTMIPTGFLTWFYSASFVSSSTGWMVGTNGMIYKTTTGGANIPNAPSNLVGFAISTSKIFLAWFDNSSGEQGFKIERSVNNPSNFAVVGTVGPNTLNYIDSTGISPGNTYYYRVNAYSAGGNSGYSNVVAVVVTSLTPIGTVLPDKYALYNNYPNPFNPSTKVKFDVPKSDFVSLKVYNMQGQEVAILVQENLGAGRYEMDFDGSYLSTGTYFYRIETSSFTETKKMILVK